MADQRLNFAWDTEDGDRRPFALPGRKTPLQPPTVLAKSTTFS